MTLTDRLNARLGGHWTRGRVDIWKCDDGKRWIARTIALIPNGTPDSMRTQWWLYGDGPPRRAERYVGRGLGEPPPDYDELEVHDIASRGKGREWR